MPFALLLSAAVQLPPPPPAPPPGYWQQRVSYDITATLDESRGVLAGTQRIVYRNHSPDTLRTFSLHLYLNAFRPGSRWADADSAERRRRFNDLADPDHGFNHVRDVRIMGQPVEPVWPLAPDSTIVRFALPRPLAPGDSMDVTMAWDARPSTVVRRQGRRGRHYDFAQWYPRVVAYDRHGWQEHALYPAGEFYGEFGDYTVRLDVPEDQVIGATGVPVCGDPGWARANRHPGRPVDYRRDWYRGRPGARAPGPEACAAPAAPGRKTVTWFADDVHHFALSMNPQYRYEGGGWGDVAIHVLYQPGDEQSWGGDVAVKRTAIALAWLHDLFGPFPWPQVTNVHRIDGGGTEFPMMMHNGSASQGLIVHELGHNYVMGILANNEWREGWLDEGFTSFQTTLFNEAMGTAGGYERAEATILDLDLDGLSEPTSLVSEAYRDFSTYNTMIYTRGELFFHQLRYLVGDETLRRILRTYYDRWKLRHVDEAAFRAVAEEVSGRDLSTFFGQWLHSTDLYDYAVGRARRRQVADGRWETRVEVVRKAPGRIPVEVWVFAAGDTAMVRAEGLAEREWVTVATRTPPRKVMVDPRVRTHDWNMLDNQRTFGWSWNYLTGPDRPVEHYLDTWFSTRERRDRLTMGWMPTVWYNDAGGVTLGARTRDDYLGRFEQNVTLVTGTTGWGADANPKDVDVLVRLKNPTWLRSPGLSQTFEGFLLEGRYGVGLGVEKTDRPHLGFGPVRTMRAAVRWVATRDMAYLDPGFYDDAGTVELTLGGRVTDRLGGWQLMADASLAGGVWYRPNGGSGSATYLRAVAEGSAKRALGGRFNLALRGFAGVVGGGPVRQRQLFVQGADPYEQLMNPFTRSTGALLVRPDLNYHVAGGGNLRGFAPTLGGEALVAVNAEVERTVLARPRWRLLSRLAVAGFGDVGYAAGARTATGTLGDVVLADAGLGVRADHRIGDTRFTTRVDLPLYVSRPAWAQDAGPSGTTGFRWTFSFQPTF